jgi:hypothetical protein
LNAEYKDPIFTTKLNQDISRSSKNDPIDIIKKYARITAAVSTITNFAAVLFVFRNFILASFYAILEETGDFKIKKINDIIRISISSNFSAAQLKRIRRRVIRMNYLISELDKVN